MSSTGEPQAARPNPLGIEPVPLPESVVPSYWRIVGKAFYRPVLTKLAVMFVFLIVFAAVFVPFIANRLPYTIELLDPQSHVFHRVFPLFRSLTTTDYIVLFLAGAGLIVYGIHRALLYRPIDQRASIRRPAALILLTAVVLTSVAAGLWHREYLDNTPYSEILAAGQARSAVMPPIHWGYADAEPLESDMVFKGPIEHHPLGTDGNGEDALARLLWACRVVLGIGLIAELISVVLGILYGALMGYFAGAVDILGMRFVEMVESIPTLFLIIIFVAIFGRKIWIITLILGFTGWTGLARFVRAEYLRIRQLDYVASATASGIPLPSILFKHIFPNALSPILVVVSFGIAGAITSESILSFLGLGLEPPTPSWGIMLNEAGNPAEIFRPWLALPPGLMIFLTIFACNIIGESLRDAMDPRINRLQ